MEQINQKYKYEESGLSNVFIEGLQIQDDAGEECVMIPNIYGLHKMIAQDLLTVPGKMEGEQIRFIRTEMGLSCADIAALTGQKVNDWKDVESDKHSLSRMGEACFRTLAMEKLKLNRASQEEIVGWCKGKRRNKINIQALSDPAGFPVGEYRMIAA